MGGLLGGDVGNFLNSDWGWLAPGAKLLNGGIGGMMPNYQNLADQQTQANRPNQSTPFGSSRWTRGPDGQWTQTTGLNGAFRDAANRIGGNIAGGPNLPGLMNGQAARDQAISSAYGYATSRLDPQFAQRETALHSQLANQGLDPNSEAAQTAQGNFGRERNDAYNGAMSSAIGQGTAAGNSIFQNSLAARGQAQNEYNSQFGQLGLLNSLGQMPSFYQSGDKLGAADLQNKFYGGLFEGVGGLAGGVGKLFAAGA